MPLQQGHLHLGQFTQFNFCRPLNDRAKVMPHSISERSKNSSSGILERAQGCLLGQLAGDALGSLVEFQTPSQILRHYPDGVRDLADGGTWQTIAGQPTDDSEMALMLARSLVNQGRFDREAVRQAYIDWLESGPFDCGYTVKGGLQGRHNPRSQANGALMRISPLGIFGANYDLEQVAEWARQDAAITHIHPVCQDANALFAMAIAHALRSGCDARALYEQIVNWALEAQVDETLTAAVAGAAEAPPADFVSQAGWVLIGFQNALWQLLHARDPEHAIIDTVMRGGDSDTNAAITGALLGAVWGLNSIPERWAKRILNCRPQAGLPHVIHPRPERFWPLDALELAERLIGAA